MQVTPIPSGLLLSPWWLLLGFFVASALLLACLNHMERQGLEGTVLGTLVMPYGSGAPNIIFVGVLVHRMGSTTEVVVNALVNNVTNLSILLGLPALIYGLEILPTRKIPQKERRERRLNRLSLMLTLIAALFFAALTWALGKDGTFSTGDGVALVASFVFWQCFHVLDVMRTNVRQKRSLRPVLMLDLAGAAFGVALMLFAIDRLVAWLGTRSTGWLSIQHIGWLSGWLMVLPNAVPAFYYAARKRADIVYSSQVGDGHICIPFCIGLAALFGPVAAPSLLPVGLAAVLVLAVIHAVFTCFWGRLPRWGGALLIVAYGVFAWHGLAGQ